MLKRLSKNEFDPYSADYFATNVESLDKIPVDVFLCGSAIGKRALKTGRRRHRDIRLFLKSRLERGLKRCTVKLGEHRKMIQAYSRAVGPRATNLADHELTLASKKEMDLVIIFPCSPGSFAELGMFCLVQRIATKMRIFVKRKYKKHKTFVMEGPVKAAQQSDAKVFFVNYVERERIWNYVHELVLEVKAKKRKRSLLSE